MIDAAFRRCVAEAESTLDIIWRDLEDESECLAGIIMEPETASPDTIKLMAQVCLMQCSANRAYRMMEGRNNA